MEKLIHQYLDENYFPYKEGNDHYRIYINDMEWEIFNEKRPTELYRDLNNIYGASVFEVKRYVYSWAVKYFPDIDLSKYWGRFIELDEYLDKGPKHYEVYYGMANNNFDNITLPMVQRVVARTVAQDLVSVQPMSAPKVNLMYLDYVYEPKLTFKQKLNRILNKVKIFIRKMEKDIRKYLHITNYNSTFVTQLE